MKRMTPAPCKRRFNTSILVGPEGDVLLKYRKIHLPGHAAYDPKRVVQHLEKRYFEVGNLGFPVIRAPMGSMSKNIAASDSTNVNKLIRTRARGNTIFGR